MLSTLSDLQGKINESTGISIESQRLLVGFPPTEIDLSAAQTTTLEASGIKNGDSINVQEKILANTQATIGADNASADRGETTKKRKRETKTKGKRASTPKQNEGVVHTLHGKIFGATKRGPAKRQKTSSIGSVSKDQAAFQDAAAQTLEEALIQAVSAEEGNEGEDPLTKFLRSGTQNALRQREQETLATYRFQGSSYFIQSRANSD